VALLTAALVLSCSTLDNLKDRFRPDAKPRERTILPRREPEPPPEQSEEATESAKTDEAAEPQRISRKTVEAVQRELSEVQMKLVEGASLLLGREEIALGGRSYNSDCSGTVRAIYEYAGIDLTSRFARYTGNGVTRIFRMLEEEDLLYDTEYPVPGDVIFWDNTYDRDGDGRWNDELTHIGMVTESYVDGTIRYTHFHYGRNSVVMENMNLLTPNVYKKSVNGESIVVNAPMRIREKGVSYPINQGLTSHLYRIFGKGYLMEKG